jgi:hypothetical protein
MSDQNDRQNPERDDVLMFSVAEYWPIVAQILEAARPRRIIEAGVQHADMTQHLVSWAERHDARVLSFDPALGPVAAELAARHPELELRYEISHAVLPTVADGDFFILDTDHNYYTVSQELRIIHENTPHPHVICVHDIGWPNARRDTYYDPTIIPPSGQHAHTYEGGVVPGNPGMAASGWRGEGAFAVALHEGGPRNGVLTALEDFLAAHPDYVLHTLAPVFGLGVLTRRDHPALPEIMRILAPFHENSLLQAIERNRLLLYVRLIEVGDAYRALEAELDQTNTSQAALLAELERQIAHLSAEHDATQAALAGLESTLGVRLLRRWWRVKARLARPGARAGAWLGLFSLALSAVLLVRQRAFFRLPKGGQDADN